MRNTLAILPALLFGVTACYGTTAQFEENLNTWVGSSADELVAVWGPPDSYWEYDKGGKLLVYAWSRDATVPGTTYTVPTTSYDYGTIYGTYDSYRYSGTTTTYNTYTSPGYTVNFNCVVKWHVTIKGILKSWEYEGNDCRA